MNDSLFAALSGIGEDLVLEAQAGKVRTYCRRRAFFQRAAAVAACLCLVVFLFPGDILSGATESAPASPGSSPQSGSDAFPESVTDTQPTETEETIP